ncbi:hypothetical protein AVEN_95479-1 [Araneus ventricosus]|uniref:Uncharacterized protein n=1 Tax=Araneus ventricosus TaxID=182803 RepID=A0A4Y2RA03_ARAVE|nr:hypothetical protein AVEN_95479-1 [Araneus ventricosus]
MKLILNRLLQWFVCQLHANEIPIRHLFAHVDKTTTGPRSLTAEIRKSLAGCEKLSVVSSTPIENTLCEVTYKKDLSTDQLYLTWSSKSFLRRLPTPDVADRNSAKAICLRILLPCIAFSELKKRCAHAL